MSFIHLFHSAKSALVATLVVSLIGLASYVALEPVVSRGAVEIFTVSQSITGEISFYASTTDVTMSPSIPGVTGGTANGAATAIVTTNSTGGYYMTIQFSSTTAMLGEQQGGYINNYTPTNPNLPDYNFAIGGSGTPGEFAYTVRASSTADVDPTFLSNGVDTCGTGSNNDVSTCWYNASTSDTGDTITAETIINRSTPTPATGATTTLLFRVSVPSNPAPVLPVDTYTATATLTATAQ